MLTFSQTGQKCAVTVGLSLENASPDELASHLKARAKREQNKIASLRDSFENVRAVRCSAVRCGAVRCGATG